MTWFKDLIINGLQTLVALRLRGTPSAETLPAVAKIWVAALSTRNIRWDEDLDRDRLRKAFVEVAATATHWPSPAEFIALIPPRKPQNALPPPVDKSMSPETRKMLDDLLNRMKKNVTGEA